MQIKFSRCKKEKKKKIEKDLNKKGERSEKG